MRIFVLLSVVLATCALAEALFLDVFDVIRGDTHFKQGSTLRLNCSLPPNTNSDTVRFTFQHRGRNPVRCVPAEYISTENDVAVLVISNVTEAWAGVYTCSLSDFPCAVAPCLHTTCPESPLEEDAIVLAMSNDVVIEPPTKNVTNFRCVLPDWGDGGMKCKWNHPENYYSSWSSIRVNTTWILNSYYDSRIASECPQATPVSCTWPIAPLPLAYTIKIMVKVTNVHTNDSTEKLFSIELFNVIKPTPINSLSVQHSTSKSCINIAYSHARVYRPKIFRFKLRPLVQDQPLKVIGNSTTHHYTACGLSPHLAYILVVDVLPIGGYNGYWSAPTYTIVGARATKRNGAIADTAQCTPLMRNHIYSACTWR